MAVVVSLKGRRSDHRSNGATGDAPRRSPEQLLDLFADHAVRRIRERAALGDLACRRILEAARRFRPKSAAAFRLACSRLREQEQRA